MAASSPLFVLVTLALLIGVSLAWAGADAAKRGRSSTRIILLCFLTWPLGLFIWQSIRPPPRLR